MTIRMRRVMARILAFGDSGSDDEAEDDDSEASSGSNLVLDLDDE